MSETLKLKVFEEFQRRSFRTATLIYFAALAAAMIAERQLGPLVGGIFIGGAAALGANRYRVWTMRRLALRLTPKDAGRYPLISAGRYVILAAGVVAAVLMARRFQQDMYVFAAAGAMLIPSLAIVIEALRDSLGKRKNSGA